jgi:hypothetical protein
VAGLYNSSMHELAEVPVSCQKMKSDREDKFDIKKKKCMLMMNPSACLVGLDTELKKRVARSCQRVGYEDESRSQHNYADGN